LLISEQSIAREVVLRSKPKGTAMLSFHKCHFALFLCLGLCLTIKGVYAREVFNFPQISTQNGLSSIELSRRKEMDPVLSPPLHYKPFFYFLTDMMSFRCFDLAIDCEKEFEVFRKTMR
jgi:hypothetical protein